MGNTLRAVVSLAPSLVRVTRGAVVRGHRRRPVRMLELYDGVRRHLRTIDAITNVTLYTFAYDTARMVEQHAREAVAADRITPFMDPVRFQAGGVDPQGDFLSLLLGGGAVRRERNGPEHDQEPGQG